MLLSLVIELFIQLGAGGEYHISLDYQVTPSIVSFFPISYRNKVFFPGKNSFFSHGKGRNTFLPGNTQPCIFYPSQHMPDPVSSSFLYICVYLLFFCDLFNIFVVVTLGHLIFRILLRHLSFVNVTFQLPSKLVLKS